jgi:uncharacterized repeat protein (TIGR01451 family)
MDENIASTKRSNWLILSLPIALGLLFVALFLWLAGGNWSTVFADPIPPPEGYPKFLTSVKQVSPTLATTGGTTLTYRLEIRNTGAYTAENTTVVDALPDEVTYNGDAWAGDQAPPTYDDHTLTWNGDVGFDSTVVITYSVYVSPTFSGSLTNTAVISQPLAMESTTISAEAVITDDPIFTIEKSSAPDLPGAGKTITYNILVGNVGQPADQVPITVTDQVPVSTTLKEIGPDGFTSDNSVVTWTRDVTLDTGESTEFWFSVTTGDVPSGTVITNDSYSVQTAGGQVVAGEPYTTTVVDPDLLIWKTNEPDPPGSNRELTYFLTLLNRGSLATDLVITDQVPSGVEYLSGGSESNGLVTWQWPSLDTGESAEFQFTVYVSDVMDVPVTNAEYGACSAEGICVSGRPITAVVDGPHFEVTADLNPIAKKPGGGGGPVTPTFTIKNIGPGNALDALAYFEFNRISVSLNDLVVIPSKGTIWDAPDCGDKCDPYYWQGDLSVGEIITITTIEGQSTIGGEEGTIYSATLTISDEVGDKVTEPVSATAQGMVTHFSNLIPTKAAPAEIGSGQIMTYTIDVWNSGLGTDETDFWPNQILTEVVPLSTTLIWASDDFVTETVSNTTLISWTLPHLSPGDRTNRSFAVIVDEDLPEGTPIVNDQYGTLWYESTEKAFFTKLGEPVTTTVKAVGLIDSFKTATPQIQPPGPEQVVTYAVHLVNSGPHYLQDVTLYDFLPWQDSTYQRDATAGSGQVISDIVSVQWQGDLSPNSTEIVEMSVLVDPYFTGALLNQGVISHTLLAEPVIVEAVAYISDKPIFEITKAASHVETAEGDEIYYTILVRNMGQRATEIEIVDSLPGNTSYLPGSANKNGWLDGNEVHWSLPLLEPGESVEVSFGVSVGSGSVVVNDLYWVSSAEGVTTFGEPVVTVVAEFESNDVYLPLILK